MNQTPLFLTEEEKETMANWLSKRARIGGWFMIGLAAFYIGLILWASLREGSKVTYTGDGVIAVMMPMLALAAIGGWLLSRRRHVRHLLDEPLHLGNGRLINLCLDAYSGHQMKLQIETAVDETMVASFGYLGKATWQVGDEIPLVFWQDGRFCPRHFDHIVDFGHLPTPERKRRQRRLIVKILVWWLILSALGLLIGLYGQGRQ